jgi:hypothetical protein
MSRAWNYANHGLDWNFTDCNNTYWVQSPIDTTQTGTNHQTVSWLNSAFSFLPDYASSTFTKAQYGVQNSVFTLSRDISDGSTPMGVLYAAAPVANFANNNQLYLVAKEIRFHWPAENLIAGKQHDLEMQIVHDEPEHRGVMCNGTSIVSVFFSLSND